MFFRQKMIQLSIMCFLILGLVLLNTISVMGVSAHDPVVEIGNISRIEGVRKNQLMGYGLVVGLAGSGDSSRNQSTVQSIANMLDEFGVEIGSDQIQSGNVAAVMVTAELPPYAYSGDNIDVTVSSIGDADSLQGGTLLQTPLRAANDKIYAVAQGSVSIGGYNVQGGGNQQRQNHPTVGNIPDGALIEREMDVNFDQDSFTLILDQPSFNTASYMSQAINDYFSNLTGSPTVARATSPARVKVEVPEQYQGREVEFIARVNNLEVRSSMQAKVVINEKTGTVVMGHNVRLSTVSVAHGNLTVTIKTSQDVSQPPSFSEGETEVTEETDIDVEEEDGHLVVVENESTIQDLVSALNAVGASPRDLIAILQQMKAAGALHAKLEIK